MTERHYPKEPTAEQCSKREQVEDFNSCKAFACWYPQMGGYVGKAVVVLEGGLRAGAFLSGGDREQEDGCFNAFVWHDGEFPFGGEGDRNPARIHHCMPSQFVEFGELVQCLQSGRVPEADE